MSKLNFIDALNFRYATKQFDSNYELDSEVLKGLMEAINLAPTSYGFQPFKVVLLQEGEIRQQLKGAAYNQPQITDSNSLLVFCAVDLMEENRFWDYVNLAIETRNLDREGTTEYFKGVEQMFLGMSPEDRINWASRQIYIALGVAMSYLAINQIDSCPMEGFDPNGFDEILGIDKDGMKSTVLLTVGKRSEKDATANMPKVRKAIDKLFVWESQLSVTN